MVKLAVVLLFKENNTAVVFTFRILKKKDLKFVFGNNILCLLVFNVICILLRSKLNEYLFILVFHLVRRDFPLPAGNNVSFKHRINKTLFAY